MADFRQLALEFVLADEEAKQTSLAKQAATGRVFRPLGEPHIDCVTRDRECAGKLQPPSCGALGRGCATVDARERRRRCYERRDTRLDWTSKSFGISIRNFEIRRTRCLEAKSR